MITKIKNFFKKNKQVNNESGNVLVIALVLVTVLTFSISTITSMSVNVATSATNEMNILNEENEAKANIRLAIKFFEEWVKNPANNQDFDQFNVEYEGADSVYGVTILDDTDNIEGLDNQVTEVAKAYKFSVPLSDGRTIFMYDYVTYVGIQTDELETFDYSLATNGDLIMASGFYESDHWGGGNQNTPIKIYGNSIYMSDTAPFIRNNTTNQELTPIPPAVPPKLTVNGVPAQMHFTTELQYCGTSDCFQTSLTGEPFEIDKDKYFDFSVNNPVDQGTSGSVQILDFFGDFDYNEYMIDFIEGYAPRYGDTITASWDDLANDIYTNSSPFSSSPYNWPTDAFVDITEDWADVDFSDDFEAGRGWRREVRSMVYFGNDINRDWYPYDIADIPTISGNALHIQGDINMRQTGWSGFTESLVVFGDLYLDDTNDQDINGEIIVTGNLYLEGGNKNFEGTMMVFGETFINLDNNHQIESDFYDGFTFMAKDNIHFISHDERHAAGQTLSDVVTMFMYTEESVYIDAVNSRLHIQGVLYARALGASDNVIFMETDNPEGGGNVPVRGIVINSLYGVVRGDNVGGVFQDGTIGDDSYRFRINVITNRNVDRHFENLPTFESVIVDAGQDPLFFVTEFEIE